MSFPEISTFIVKFSIKDTYIIQKYDNFLIATINVFKEPKENKNKCQMILVETQTIE